MASKYNIIIQYKKNRNTENMLNRSECFSSKFAHLAFYIGGRNVWMEKRKWFCGWRNFFVLSEYFVSCWQRTGNDWKPMTRVKQLQWTIEHINKKYLLSFELRCVGRVRRFMFVTHIIMLTCHIVQLPCSRGAKYWFPGA